MAAKKRPEQTPTESRYMKVKTAKKTTQRAEALENRMKKITTYQPNSKAESKKEDRFVLSPKSFGKKIRGTTIMNREIKRTPLISLWGSEVTFSSFIFNSSSKIS
jgi:hypothetical protein